MTHIRVSPQNPRQQQLSGRILLLALSLNPLLAVGAPAQKPLLTASEPPKPNVVLTLDDSGSMNWHMMPDDVAKIITYTQTRGPEIGTLTTYSDRRDTRACRDLPNIVTAPPDPTPSNTNCYRSIVATPIYSYSYTPNTTQIQLYPRIHPNDQWGYNFNYSGNVGTEAKGANGVDNLFAARFRSSDINSSYYNPNTEYVPWPAAARSISSSLVDADGYVIDYTKVPIFPDGDGAGGVKNETVDLVTTIDKSEHDWCISGVTSINNRVCPGSVQTFHPAVYFKLKSGRTGNAYDDFDRIDITAITDPVSKAAQLKNFVTWFTYYRSRILTAKGAVALAFSKQPDDKFRLGYGNINNRLTANWSTGSYAFNINRTAIDGYQSHLLAQGVRLFNDKTSNTKTKFFSWIRDLLPNGAVGTPLRMAMDDVGGYYSFKSDEGDPYRTNPTVSTDTALACRRSYHILVTDGYWNDPDQYITKGNVDNTGGPTVTGPNAASYTYSAISPFKDNASNTLADVAMHYWKNDIRPDLDNVIPISDAARKAPNDPANDPAFWQHVTNFMVGLGVDGTVPQSTALDQISWPDAVYSNSSTTVDDLWHASINSRGKYLKATDPIGFADELSGILSQITTQGGTVAGVAVSNSYVADGSLKLVPSFEPAQWSGELKGIVISATGQEKTAPAPWLASEKVPTFAKRNIWTKVGENTVEFTFNNLPTNDPLALGHIRSSAGVGEAPALNADLVNYLRGDSSRAGDASNKPYRPRPEKSTAPNGYNVLGTFVNSLPIYVKANNFGNVFLPSSVNGQSTGSGSYNSYVRDTKKPRAGLVLIGGNDGMLHGFRGSDGVEMFAYIPQTLLKGSSHPLSSAKNLYGLARLANKGYQQQFYMDGQITEADISSCTGTGTAASCGWKNIAVASAGGGGKAVVALNVTPNFGGDSAEEPSVFSGSNVLWEIDQNTTNDLGYVMAAPQVGMMASGQWAAVFGNGFDSASGNATLIIVNASTGQIIRTITASTGGNGLGGVRLVRNADNVVVQAYAGDLQGNVWKFDLSSSTPAQWKVDMGGAPLFTASKNSVAQPITAAPNYLIHPQGGVMVYVSTGKLYSESDTGNTSPQTIYGLWDKAKVGEPQTTSNNQIPMNKLLTQVVQEVSPGTSGNSATFRIVADAGNSSITDNRGWKLDMFFANGERGIYSPQFLQDQVFVQTVRPGTTSGESCEIAKGSGYRYILNPFTGAKPLRPVLDLNGDGAIGDVGSPDDSPVSKTSSDGQEVIQGGDPKGSLIGAGTTPTPTSPLDRLIDRNWRQIFWIIQ